MHNLNQTKLKHNQQHSYSLWTDSEYVKQCNHNLRSDYFQASFKQPDHAYSKLKLTRTKACITEWQQAKSENKQSGCV